MGPLLVVLAMCSVALSSTSGLDQELFFGLMIGDQNQENMDSGALSGVQAALDEVNQRTDLLSGYKLSYELVHSQVL